MSQQCTLQPVTAQRRNSPPHLFVDWRLCDSCGFPPHAAAQSSSSSPSNINNTDDGNIKKLLICAHCKSAAYHDSTCQREHWTRPKNGHRVNCKKRAIALRPILDLILCSSSDTTGCANEIVERSSCCVNWWKPAIVSPAYDRCSTIWRDSVEKWNIHQDYLPAMEGFQQALQPTFTLWIEMVELINHTDDRDRTKTSTTMPTASENDKQRHLEALTSRERSLSYQLAQRLLFCSYCEADGNQIQTCRIRLVQCISILIQCRAYVDGIPASAISTLQDAFMELMLSYEEVADSRILARHVAQLAIQYCGCDGSSAIWTNPLQRPGYMGRIDTTSLSKALPYMPPEEHPNWCGYLESNWQIVANELNELQHQHNRKSWGTVGCGNRGSGGDDHRVVSAGGRWTEYVLFGTGASSSDIDAPLTKRLLRQYVHDAVSLAESGGGEIIFSCLAPHTHIDPHCGPTNLRWTAHLGLVVPNNGNCRIRVGDEWHSWYSGKILLFDDSFEHEVVNETDSERIVLLIRLWHPKLCRSKREETLNHARLQKELASEKRYHPPS
jgi:hypothetical protein